MRTHDDHLGQGAGRRMLNHIVETARNRGYDRLSLETGRGEAFEAAIHLYESSGFKASGPFGAYEKDPFSTFLTLQLQEAETQKNYST